MSGRELAAAERYWVLVHAATGRAADLSEARYAAGAILLALRDLQALSCLTPDANGKLAPFVGAAGRPYLGTLLAMTLDAQRSELEWVDRLCLSPTSKRLRRVIGELTVLSARDIDAPLARQRGLAGLITGAQAIDRSHPALRAAARDALVWLGGAGDDRAAVLHMLDVANITRPLARIDDAALRRAFARHRETPAWRSCDEAAALVRNAAFMSATLTGAL